MKIIDNLKKWWERLEEDEKHTVKLVALLALPIAALAFVANFFLIPYVFPALAGAALGIAIGLAILAPIGLAIKLLGPMVVEYLAKESVKEELTQRHQERQEVRAETLYTATGNPPEQVDSVSVSASPQGAEHPTEERPDAGQSLR